MINKKLMMVALVLIVAMPVKAGPSAKIVPSEPAHDVTQNEKDKNVKKENKKVENAARVAPPAKAPQHRAIEVAPSADDSKKIN